MDENVFVTIAEAASRKLVIESENDVANINVKKTTKLTNRRPLATLAFHEIKSHINVNKKDTCKVNGSKKTVPQNVVVQSLNAGKKVSKEKLKEEEKCEKIEKAEKAEIKKEGDVKVAKVTIKQQDKENDIQLQEESKGKITKTQEEKKDDKKLIEEKENLIVEVENVKIDENIKKEDEVNDEKKDVKKMTEKDLLSDEVIIFEEENKENVCPDHEMTEAEESSVMSVDVIESIEAYPYSDRYLIYQCPEYSQDIFNYLLKCQERYKPDPNYMAKQKEINSKMRSILIDWLVEVTEEYKMTPETLFLAVNFIDRFLSTMGISRQNFQLLGTTALFISSKYEEIYPPEITEFVYITDDAYTKHQVLGMEKVLLRVLKFDVSAPTIHYFLKKYLIEIDVSQVIGILSEYICYLCIVETNPTLYYLPNDIAIGALLLASYLCGQRMQNNIKIKTTIFPNLSEEQIKAELIRLKPLFETMQTLLRTAKDSQQQAVYYKYSTERYYSVASIVMSNTSIEII